MSELITAHQSIEPAEAAKGADIVFGVPNCDSWETIQSAADAISGAVNAINPSLKTVLVYSDAVRDARALASSSVGQPLLLPSSMLPLGRLRTPIEGLNNAQRALFLIGRNLEGSACIVFGSEPANITTQSCHRLIEPLMNQRFDLVMPCYSRKRFEGLINNGLIYPLIRALYGKRVRYPIAMDFGFSSRLIQRYVQPDARNGTSSGDGPPIWIVTDAVRAGLRICQTYLSAPVHATRDPTELSTVLAQVVGALFTDLEHHASFWQKVRGSQPLPTFGKPVPVKEESGAVDAHPMIESFQLGVRNLSELWGKFLPPTTLLEMKKLHRMPPDAFHMADEWWARIVYDFALANHLHVMSRDHLLGALTPLYLAWVASFALESQRTAGFNLEQRIERLCLAFESQKPYLQSRWRWPDRFNP
ncbi:MAG: hypothetical protein HYX72_04540 [Acidobacteria bacterium]|nr:hypothetical protein [Acidobacteriota bacterium]